jgi:hypothetical protein
MSEFTYVIDEVWCDANLVDEDGKPQINKGLPVKVVVEAESEAVAVIAIANCLNKQMWKLSSN